MVGMMAGSSREEAVRLLNSIKFSMDVNAKIDNLYQLKELLLRRDPSLVPEFVTPVLELHADRFSPVRKSVAEMIVEIGFMYTEFIPEMVSVLITFLEDDTPPVARQAIISGTNLFRSTLEKLAIQGLHSSELDDSTESSWKWMLKFKDELYQMALHPGNDGIRSLAAKFVESVVLLYTPDPNGSSESPPHQASAGKVVGFDISWLRGGHPLLNVADLSMEASQSLGLMLDQLRFPKVKSLSNSIIIVLIKSLSAIAKKRPAFYGRILPVLLGLEPSSSVIKGVRVAGVHHSLKNAFLSCLKCTNPGAAPWRDRLVSALNEIKAGVQDGMNESHVVKEEEISINARDPGEVDNGRKRSVIQEDTDLVEDNNLSRKRVRQAHVVSEVSDVDRKPNFSQGSTSSSGEGDTGPVQQLVAMFGALVAQGEKAVGSLDILISSISADLLAEVVMANMRQLPPTRPAQPSPIVSGTATLSSVFPQLATLLVALGSASHDVTEDIVEDEQPTMAGPDIASVHPSSDATETMTPVGIPGSPNVVVPPGIENDSAAKVADIQDMETLESEIPGLDTIRADKMPKTEDASHLAYIDLPGLDHKPTMSLDPLDFTLSGSVPTDRSEELSPKIAVSDANSAPSTATSALTTSHFVLPKMSAPVIDLTDNQKDNLQTSAFERIVEGYKQISVAGESRMRSSLLAHLGIEYPLDLDPWKLLKKHILSDYLNHEGHELTLSVLYRLFREAEQENDFFSSTTATSTYETFLLTVAEILRDSFPASDKSLSRLLGEVPYIPKSTFKLLECLCSPGNNEKTDKEVQSGDRVTQGLSVVWSLILLRPSIRDVCLKIALQSAVHHLEEVRMKAIRLVANKLYPISSITQQIEDFASEMLFTVMKGHDVDEVNMEGSEVQQGSGGEKPPNEQREGTSDTNKPCSTSSTSSSLISEAQRHMSLYFALCTKKHSLFRQVFVIYKSIPKAVTQAVHRQIPILVRTIGSSSELLAIISDPPNGSKSLLMQVLHILTDGTVPSPELVSTVKRLYDSKLKDVDILIPVLPSLPKDQILKIFPQLVNLPLDKFQSALARILQVSSHSTAALTPAEVLIAIHGIDPERDEIPLKKVTDACNACFEQRQVFTQQVLAKVLNQLVEQIPLPLLFMRTVLQAIGAFPALVDFIMEILSRLVTKQTWKYPKLWVGFLKCALLTKPHSFSVLLQLPAAQLESALNRTAAPLKPALIAHANQPNIRPTLPRSTLVVLGIVSDVQTTSQSMATPPPTAETSNSVAEELPEKSKESSTA